MRQEKPNHFQAIIDTSSLIALERAGILNKLAELDMSVVIPQAVALEFGKEKVSTFRKIETVQLKGNSIKKSKELVLQGFGRGEAECVVLALCLGTDFIVCDDRKFIRRKYFLEPSLEKIDVMGFSFLLHILVKNKEIPEADIWGIFDDIIEKNNWKRSEIEVSNYVFLREMGY